MRVIERTTSDLERETVELYQQCKPLLDDGVPIEKAVKTVKGIRLSSNIGNNAWYRRFRDYAVEQGYVRKR
jgi:hypothetical protein